MTDTPAQHARGHFAEHPWDIPWRGWKDILLRTWTQSTHDHIGLVSAGVAFYGLLALFPAITALIAVAGLVLAPDQITEQLSMLSTLMPEGAATIILDQARAVTGSDGGGLTVAALLGVGIALWSTSRGVGSLVEGINIAYDERETRSLLTLTATRLGLTLFLVVGFAAGLASTIVIPGILGFVALGASAEMLIEALRWIVLVAMTVVGLAVLYRYAPDRARARWRWLTPGAVLATLLWVAASFGFALYVQNFASYQESFGTLAGVIILLMWLWLSSYVILLGAELDAETEAQTRVDTTVGPEKALGERGARKADVVVD
ncbi:MAG: YihY/virulence factor BrkB family protein [Maritimibacter sp.]|nr:YihY/virulence factor BrkB family protein [Maritimibacter sp.]